MKRLAEFSDPKIPLEEIKDFYSIPETRKIYCWSNSLISVDGMLHFLESSKNVGEIGLKHISEINPNQEADWRLLNASRAYADAVLLTGQIIRDESDADCSIKYQDLIEFRLKELKKTQEHPIQCILSESGNFPLDRPLFHLKGQKVWIFTSYEGEKRIQKEMDNVAFSVEFTFFQVNPENAIQEMLDILEERGIRYLDVSSGGRVIRKFLDLKLLHEIRMTMAGHIIGPFNSKGELRPSLFPKSPNVKSYTPENAPLISWKGIRTCGEHFIFYRGSVQHR